MVIIWSPMIRPGDQGVRLMHSIQGDELGTTTLIIKHIQPNDHMKEPGPRDRGFGASAPHLAV